MDFTARCGKVTDSRCVATRNSVLLGTVNRLSSTSKFNSG